MRERRNTEEHILKENLSFFTLPVPLQSLHIKGKISLRPGNKNSIEYRS
jgi:hypothetical protein